MIWHDLVWHQSRCSNKRLAYSDAGRLGIVAAWLAESVWTAGFPLLTGLEAALAFAAGPPLIAGLIPRPLPFTGSDALSLSSATSKMGATNWG